MQSPFVYLAGPILDCTKSEANDWRRHVARELGFYNITGISPLRCEPLIGDRYLANYPDPKFGTAKAIAAKNKFDVSNCDLVFAYLPKQDRVSIGTILEIGWASVDISRPIIVVTDDPFLMNHPVLTECCGWCLPTLDAGIEVTVGLLGGYAGGKHV